MGDIKAGVVVVTKFCKSSSRAFGAYIDYIDREEASRAENSYKYNLYQDYMGNPEKATGLFTKQREIQEPEEKENLKKVFRQAQEKGSLMWQTVISFDNRWLEQNGLYKDQMLDEERLKNITRSAVHKMLEKENLSNAVWSAAIHYNTDNIHIHIATVEPDPMREKREYVQYNFEKENGRYVKKPVRDGNGQVIKKSEYKGTFRQSSIDVCRREMVNQIINERENNLKINSIIRESIVKQKREHPLAKDKELCSMFLDLYQKMPDCSRNMWNYNNPIMKRYQKDIDKISREYIQKYHTGEMEELQQRLQIQEQKYKESYGQTERNYADNKTRDLYERLGNAVMKEIRGYDKECRKGGGGLESVPMRERKGWDTENQQGSQMTPLTENEKTQGVYIEKKEVSFPEEEKVLTKIAWNESYKRARKMIHKRPPEYEKAIQLLQNEYRRGNILAAYELGDIYHYGRGRKINTEKMEYYYQKAFEGFYQMYYNEDYNQVNEGYLSYRIGKMYYYGQGTEQDYEEAKMYFEHSDSPYAVYMLGKMAYSGQGMEQDYEEAFSCFKKVAKKNPYAAYQVASMIEQKKAEGTEEQVTDYYRKAFEGFFLMEENQEDDNLEYRIGSMYLRGKGTEEDPDKAEEYLSKAAEAGNLYAKNSLAMMYLEQKRYDKLPEIISVLTEVAEKTENIWSMYALGNIYSMDEYDRKDLKKAVSWYLRAEGESNEFISYKLGKMYLDTESELYNSEKAVVHFEKAWKAGSSIAAYQLGKIYSTEEHGMADANRAYHWFSVSFEDGNMYAGYRLGKINYEKKDYEKAEAFFLQCDDMYSHYYLGKIYLDQAGKRYDLKKGLAYMKRAAEEGNTYAELNIGILYLKGEVVKRDVQEAKEWITRAAEHGNEFAANMLNEWDSRSWYAPPQHIRRGISLQTAISRMKKGLKSELEKARAEREHTYMVEQAIEN